MESNQVLLEILPGILQLFLAVWLVWVILGLFWLTQLALKLHKAHRLSRAGIAEIDHMAGEAFEQYLEGVFKKLGYRVKRTPYQGDYGADLIIQKDGNQIAVQAKRYNHRVGVKAVQEAVAARDYYQCQQAMVVTNSYYSQQARNLARANKVELWDRKKLADTLRSIKKNSAQDAEPPPLSTTDAGIMGENATSITSDQPVCEICHKPVSQKVEAYCLAHRELFGDKIYCYEHQKVIRRNHALGSN